MLPDPQYWAPYAHMQSLTVCEAVQLTQPEQIEGKLFESGDYAVKFEGDSCFGVKKWKFENMDNYRPIGDWSGRKFFDKDKAMLERIDDLIVQTARITIALERQGIMQDASQK